MDQKQTFLGKKLEDLGVDLQAIAEFIYRKEARTDSTGRLSVYLLPVGDQGGRFEVAGICDGYHPEKAQELRALVEAGKFAEAKVAALLYIASYVSLATEYHPDTRVDVFMCDLTFNRGPRGARIIAQHAVKVAGLYEGNLDGIWGRLTSRAFEQVDGADLVPRLLLSWAWYERTVLRRDETSHFWRGLVNRRVDALQLALGIGNPDFPFK